MTKNYYHVLGVAETATAQEITKAYRLLAKDYHPDKNENQEEANAKMAELNGAYDVLKDPRLRAAYDAQASAPAAEPQEDEATWRYPGSTVPPMAVYFNFVESLRSLELSFSTRWLSPTVDAGDVLPILRSKLATVWFGASGLSEGCQRLHSCDTVWVPYHVLTASIQLEVAGRSAIFTEMTANVLAHLDEVDERLPTELSRDFFEEYSLTSCQPAKDTLHYYEATSNAESVYEKLANNLTYSIAAFCDLRSATAQSAKLEALYVPFYHGYYLFGNQPYPFVINAINGEAFVAGYPKDGWKIGLGIGLGALLGLGAAGLAYALSSTSSSSSSNSNSNDRNNNRNRNNSSNARR